MRERDTAQPAPELTKPNEPSSREPVQSKPPSALTPDARAHEGALIPQPHGGALRPPFARGDAASAGAARRGVSMRAVRRECREILLGGAEANMRRLLELCGDLDPRVSVVAIQECNTRLWGRPGDTGMADDAASDSQHDLSHLSPAQRARVRELVAELRGLLARPAGDGVVVDG